MVQFPGVMLETLNFAVVDVETTGASITGDRIIEIRVLRPPTLPPQTGFDHDAHKILVAHLLHRPQTTKPVHAHSMGGVLSYEQVETR